MSLITYKNNTRQRLVGLMILLMVNQICFPTVSLALTTGPTQPELQSFEPAGASEMVDLFSGDFNYNIPLFELPGPNGGYPVNLFYNSVTNADQESSMVGLGWNIGIGAINRQMRGLPDDFNGEKVKRRVEMKPMTTAGIGITGSVEVIGGDFGKVPDTGTESGGVALSLGFTVMHNSYQGLGFSIDPGVSASAGPRATNSAFGLSGGFGLSFNSLQGTSANGNIGVSVNGDKGASIGAGLGLGLNSRTGMRLSLNTSFSTNNTKKTAKGLEPKGSIGGSVSYDLSYNQPAYSPQVDMAFTGFNFSGQIEIGGAISGVDVKGSLKGFYSNRELKERYRETPAYGAMYQQNSIARSLQDFNREKDGAIRFKQPYLPIPSLTADALSVTGHGIGGVYQLYRSDIPFFSDQEVESPDGGFSIGGDIGISVTPHIGVNGSGNYSVERTDRPFTHRGNIGAQGHDANNPIFEPYYYKRVGELNAEIDPSSSNQYMGGDEPVQLDMNGLDFGSSLKTKSGAGLPNVKGRSERKARSMSIQPITNKELLNTQNQALLPEFDVKYYNVDQETEVDASDYISSKLTTVNRASHGDDQIAGYTTISDGGARWNFALPARNNVQVDADFSVATPANPSCAKKVDIAITGQNDDEIGYKVPGTNEYLSLTTLPAYSHAYMLTSIYGADYIDVDPSDGAPNDSDKGYWMNIEYAKTSSDYKWRTPFTKATYIQGLVNKTDDDKGMFTYGEREQYHPARMETKTHVAEYHYTKRDDGRGVAKMLQNDNNVLGDYSYKLTKISIYSKKELAAADAAGRSPIAMKNVHFTYASSADELCKNVENNGVSNGGKLTLKSVHFTYENNTRGALNPYKFEYKNSNANYEEMAFDRWGVFRPAPSGNPCYNIHSPFVNQAENPTVLNDQVATWHLTDIHLPSGSHIKINVERDQYSHEQDRVAGRIFQLKGVGNGDPNNLNDIGNDRLVSGGNPNNDAMTIYFDLEPNHIAYSPTLHNNDPIVQQEMDRYFEDMYEDELGKQLYFQVHTDLLNTGASGTEHYQSLTGYTAIADYGVVEGSHIVNNFYTKGYIRLKPFPVKVEGENYHPFLISAWQFIKSSLTDMMYGTPPASSTDSPGQAFQRLGAVFGEIAGLFRNYYKVAAEHNYGTKIDLNRSMIRLASPNQKMYGGGLRVHKVTLHDNWADEITPVYGMVYDYDEEVPYIDSATQEQKVRTISSGTATATPAIGKQESSLRYAKHFVEDLTNKQDKLHFFEHPLNESYYQGASIGYRKVTVKSLASDYAIKSAKGETPPTELGTLAPGFATSGVTVNEFYTAKDFPIITRYTYPKDWTNPVKYIPVPFIGSIRIDQYSGSQGYTVETNNMHGKPLRVAHYAQDINGQVLGERISEVKYLYKFEEEIYTEGKKQRRRKVLQNAVPVLVSDIDVNDPTKAEIAQNAEVGVERELFVDVRQKSTRGGHMGVAVNIDFVTPIFPFPIIVGSGWGDMSYSEQVVHTAVTNKIIRKSGILMRTVATDGQSIVRTDNKVFDRYTGQPVLTTVNNSYDDLIYNYNIPAHLAYDRMGAAYKNYDLRFEGSIQNKDNTGYYPLTTTVSNIIDHLVEGDEFIIEKGATKTRATLVKKTLSSGGNKLYLAIDATSPNTGSYDFILVRSGRRNHLTASVGSIAALSNPMEGRANASVNLSSQEVSSQGTTTTTNGSYAQSYQTLDDILSINAMTYIDAWDNGDKTCTLGPIGGENAFRTGDRGIFRAKDTWTYVDKRNQSSPINTQIDGTMDEVPLFNWKNPFLAYSSPYNNWKRTSEITKYNTDGTELETRNIIDIYSSAVYGYENNLPIAVANNSSHHEVGYEGFEEFNAGNVSNALPKENGHIIFVDRNTDCSMLTQQFNLVSNLNRSSTGVVIDALHYANFPVPEKAIFNLTHIDGTNFRIEHTIVGVHPYNDPSGKTYVYLEFDTPPVGNAILPTAISASEWTHFKGTANLHFKQNNSNFTNSGILLAITDEQAHTGRYSLSIAHNSEGGVGLSNAKLVLPQNDLLLRADGEKEYVFSAWVRVAGSGFGGILDSYTFDNSLNLSIGGSQIHAAGPIIDGWQRMEGKFTTNQRIATISVTLNATQLYLDDLRIFPSKGNMQSYVYDPVTYRVQATLDNNNYFSRYIYDEQGTLISVQKETPKGIKTIQETGSYVKETN